MVLNFNIMSCDCRQDGNKWRSRSMLKIRLPKTHSRDKCPPVHRHSRKRSLFWQRFSAQCSHLNVLQSHEHKAYMLYKGVYIFNDWIINTEIWWDFLSYVADEVSVHAFLSGKYLLTFPKVTLPSPSGWSSLRILILVAGTVQRERVEAISGFFRNAVSPWYCSELNNI